MNHLAPLGCLAQDLSGEVRTPTRCSSWSRASGPTARAFARVGEAGAQQRGDLRGKGKTDALDAVRIARSVLGLDTGSLRVPRADVTRHALRILVIARKMITRECTAAANALVRTEDLGIDARKALRIEQVRQVAG